MKNFTIVLIFSALAAVIQSNPIVVKTKDEQQVKGVKPNTQQRKSSRIYGAFWQIGDGFASTLIVRNKNRDDSLKATVVLFASDGKEAKRAPLQIEPNSANRWDLGTILNYKDDSSRWGGIAVQFDQSTPPSVMAQVVIENYQKGIIFDLPLHRGNSLDTEKAQYAPWYLPDDGTDGIVTLFNASGQKMMATPSLNAEGKEQVCDNVELGPHETKQLSLRKLLQTYRLHAEKTGSITLRYAGQSQGLHLALLLSNMKTGFSLAPAFNAKHNQLSDQQTAWHFPSVFASPDSSLGFHGNDKFTAYALLSNSTNSAMTPQLEAYFESSPPGDTKSVVLPIEPLGPSETRIQSLSSFIHSGLIPDNISRFSLRINHKGIPGDLGVGVFTVNQTGDFVFNSEGSVGGSRSIDSSYWDIGGDLSSLLSLRNASDAAAQVKATLRYQTASGMESYFLPAINIAGNGSVALNLRQMILAGNPDESGHIIPPGTSFGTMTLEVAGTDKKSIIFGGSTSFDPISGGYGQLYIPDCNDPGPWNNFTVYYLDGIALPDCADLYPNPCDFGGCGGGGGENPVFLDGLQYLSNGNWIDVPTGGFDNICLGSTIQFRAISNSPDPWPAGFPEWTGAANGTGNQITVTFNNSGLQAETVTDDQGDVLTVNINVHSYTPIPVTWNTEHYSVAGAMAASSTNGDPFVASYLACGDIKNNKWKLKVDKIEGSVTILVNTGGSRDPDANPPTTQAEAVDAVTVMQGYYARGARGSWHTEAASRAHEEWHYSEWQCSGNNYWPATRTALENMSVPYDSYSTPADAITAMRAGTTGADQKITNYMGITGQYFGTLCDGAGCNPYAAGQLVLNRSIVNVQNLAATNLWTVPSGVTNATTTTPCYQPFLPYTP